jgi:hypothetical protein
LYDLPSFCHDPYQVILAYNRILDLKEKHVDTEVLQILVNALCSLDVQADVKKRAEQLFTRLTQQVSVIIFVYESQWLRLLDMIPVF